MPNLPEAAALFRDLVQILFLDRLDARRRQTSKNAGAYCRSLRFHSRSKIRPLSWPALFQKLGVTGAGHVAIPGPGTDFGDVGNAEYYYALAALVKALQPGSIFEFGTYLGVSALTMAENTAPDCRIYTMDLPDSAVAEGVHELNATDEKHIVKSRARVGEAFLRSPLQNRIIQIRDDSMTFRAETCATNVDLVFVDGGHSRPLIVKDTENALRILSSNGTILWDDYFHHYPDVVTYLDELADRFPVHAIPGTNFVIYSRRWHDAAEKKNLP
jgi:predicted O-methyltransferase YrrM